VAVSNLEELAFRSAVIVWVLTFALSIGLGFGYCAILDLQQIWRERYGR
jgi:hypothetical protein